MSQLPSLFVRLAAVLVLAVLAGCATPPPARQAPPAQNRLTAVVDLSEQSLEVTRSWADGRVMGWRTPVSTGRAGFRTPTGTFHPFYLSRHHTSSLYEDAPMPWSVFFNRDVAIHGTYAQSLLGQPVSHGCVRVHTAFAQRFFEMVKEVGKANTTIVVQD